MTELTEALRESSVDAALMMFNAESNSRDHALYKDKLAHTEDVQMELSHEIQELNKQNRELSDRILQLRAETTNLTTALARQERQCQDAEGEVQALTAHLQQLTQAYNTTAVEAESRRALEALVADMVEKNHSLEERMQTLNSIEQQAKIASIEHQAKVLTVLFVVASQYEFRVWFSYGAAGSTWRSDVGVRV